MTVKKAAFAAFLSSQEKLFARLNPN